MSSETVLKPAKSTGAPASSKLPPFEVKGIKRPIGHWRMCVKTALGQIHKLDEVGDYQDYVSVAHDGVVCCGEVTEKYNPLCIADVVTHYGATNLVISPELTARIFTQPDWVSPTIANIFFWQNQAGEVFVMVLGRCASGWVLRRYRIDEAPDFMTDCRIFIPAPIKKA